MTNETPAASTPTPEAGGAGQKGWASLLIDAGKMLHASGFIKPDSFLGKLVNLHTLADPLIQQVTGKTIAGHAESHIDPQNFEQLTAQVKEHGKKAMEHAGHAKYTSVKYLQDLSERVSTNEHVHAAIHHPKVQSALAALHIKTDGPKIDVAEVPTGTTPTTSNIPKPVIVPGAEPAVQTAARGA